MPIVVKCWQVATPELNACIGRYLEYWNHLAFHGYGVATWTTDIGRAKRFDDETQAMHQWNAVPAEWPKREDGSDNKPLHAWGIEFETVKDDEPDNVVPFTRKPAATAGRSDRPLRRQP